MDKSGFVRRLAIFTLMFLAAGLVTAQDAVSTRAAVTVYEAPSVVSPALAQLPTQTSVTVEGRNDTAHWLLIQADVRGWIPSGSTVLPADIRLIDFPVIAIDTPSLPPLTSDEPLASIIERLEATPIFHQFESNQISAIIEQGRQLGSRPNVFTMIGDSNTTNGDFMRPLGLSPNYCDLGAYSYLQDTIDFFSAPPRQGVTNSFVNDSIAANKGLSTSSALDPFWATSPLCEGKESPVACEYRVVRPSIAIIMLGQIDINYAGNSAETYRANMEQIVRISLDQGVIPVLTTIIFLPERDEWPLSLAYNEALLDLAELYQIPLINLWRAGQTLPNYGIGPDRSHLSARVDYFCSFTGAEQELGGTLRNLLTLQALDTLRRRLIETAN